MDLKQLGPRSSLSVIVPTYNEAENICPLVGRLEAALASIEHELLFVDDSIDGTDAQIAAVGHTLSHIRLIHREGRGGLASGVVAGITAAQNEVLCVLDADLQHPPELVSVLLEAIERTGADLAVASRYIPGGGYGAFTAARRLASRVATGLARILLHRARSLSDPVSGFFAFRRTVVDGVTLRPLGYKILLEVLVRGHVRKVAEIPYRFQARAAGQSKLTLAQQWEYLRHIWRLLHVHPGDLRFARFALVGLSGIVVNMAAFWFLTSAGVYFLVSGIVAIIIATTSNFRLNDAFTWRDRRSSTLRELARRYGQYWVVTGAGAALQLVVLLVLTSVRLPQLLSNLVGIGFAAAWNFRANARWTWRSDEPRLERVRYTPAAAFDSGNGDLAPAAVEKRREFVRYLRDGPVPRVQVFSPDGQGWRPRVSVIIPNADRSRSADLERLVHGLRTQSPLCEVIIVQGDRRQGRAINTGAAIARGDILVTMDDDTRLGDPDVLQKLVETLDHDPSIGIAGVSNLAPEGAPPIVQRAMRELPRRSSPVVNRITDSDMAEHPCLAIRKSLFYQIGGEHEWIPRGLDPYLRQEVRQLGHRVVVVPNTWIHHLLPSTLGGILRQYFRNGLGAAYVQKFHPEFAIDQAVAHIQPARDGTWLSGRIFRYVRRIVRALFRREWIYLGSLISYAAGYAWGISTLREDSL